MQKYRLALALTLLGPALYTSASAAPAGGCDLPPFEYQGELLAYLSRRAIDAINLVVESAGGETSPALDRLVVPDAPFTFVEGDAIVRSGTGSAGLIKLAQRMKADSFRFLGWDYMVRPVNDRCGTYKAEIEFIDARRRLVYPVTFTFLSGRISAVDGAKRSFTSGRMSAPPR